MWLFVLSGRPSNVGRARESSLLLLAAVVETTLGELDLRDPDDQQLATLLAKLKAHLHEQLKGAEEPAD